MSAPPLPASGSAAFVTGGSGFVGRRLIRDLVSRSWQVRALARTPEATETVRRLGAMPVAGDLAAVAAMAEAMRGCATVFHAAARVALWDDWAAFERDTVQGTANVIAATREAGVPCLVHVGTEAVLADGGPIVNADETMPIPANPNGPYPRSKAIAERLVVAANGPALRTVVVRPRLIWGEDDTVLLPQLVAAMQAGLWVWFGDRHHRTSTCNVANVSHGMRLAAERGQGGEVYFLTDGPPVELEAFITRLVATKGVKAPRLRAPLWVADSIAAASEAVWPLLGRLTASEPPLPKTAVNLFFREVTVSDAKARRELGYAPIVTVEEGLAALAHGERFTATPMGG
jgi:nucleoside-diphosphate-sugar epimerase